MWWFESSEWLNIRIFRALLKIYTLNIWFTSCIYSNLINLLYVVASISRLFKILGLFCKRALEKRRYSAKETYNSKDPIHESRHVFTAIWCMYSNLINLNIKLKKKNTWRDSCVYSNLMYLLYVVASISRLFKIMGLFCKRALKKRRYSAMGNHVMYLMYLLYVVACHVFTASCIYMTSCKYMTWFICSIW